MTEAAEYLAVPLLFTVEPFADHTGTWQFRVGYPELLGCEIAHERLTVAMDLLDELRVRMTLDLLDGGHEPPTPRRPLHHLVPLIRNSLAIGETPDLRGAR
ncbi:hypothetical protein GIS00_00080 [Nakamurella sp. YIM 132087]|uniref:Type II toxin-antitoxin system HicB family antitoxin n=1 Tax=Nakamurella alba TaxID=2665158 RepID=A0A7K1FE15_9ACTN|nr:hypothetical protein [Nakamurella alba]MTD12338.1 hypothetical protein [Nakamurella alba]